MTGARQPLPEYVVEVVLAATGQPDPANADRLAEQLVDDSDGDVVATIDPAGRWVTVVRTMPAPSPARATARATEQLQRHAFGFAIAGVSALRTDIADERDRAPVIPELAGITEVAQILGVTRQRAHTIARDSNRFPPAVQQLAAGPVFLRSAVEHFAAHPRTPGRPRTTPDTAAS